MVSLSSKSVRRSLIAAAVAAGLMAGGMLHSREVRADGPPARSGPTADQAVGEIHEEFGEFSHDFAVTEDQKPKMKAIEDKAVETVKADPKKLMDKDFQTGLLTDVRGVLTPEQGKKIDHMLNAAKMAKDASDLHQIGLAILLWENDNAQKTPPDLGSLLSEKLSPEVFLLAGSATKVPTDWATLDDKAKADWVNKNSDYVYVGADKKPTDEGESFVVAYIKPELMTDGENVFLMGDFSAQHKPADEAKAVIADIKAGKNPSPSLKAEAMMPPPPHH